MLSVEAEPCRTLSLIKVSYTDFNSWQKRQPKNQRNMRQPSCLRASRYKGTSSLLSRRWQNTSVPTAAMEGANTRPSITASGAESLCENVHCSCFFSLKIHCLTFIVISETWWTCWLSNCKVSYHKNTHQRKATGPWFFFSPLAMNSEQTAIRTTLSFFFPNKTISFPQWKKMRTKSSWTKLSLLKLPLQRTKTTLEENFTF